MSDGQRKQQNGTYVSAPSTRQRDRWEDQKRDGKMKQTTSSIQRKLKRRKAMKSKNKATWINVAKNRERWKAIENEYATTAAAISVNSVQRRRNPPQDPVRRARYLNDGPLLQRALSSYVTLSIDNLVCLNEQQFADSVSQRAQTTGSRESATLFPEPHSCSEQNLRISQC